MTHVQQSQGRDLTRSSAREEDVCHGRVFLELQAQKRNASFVGLVMNDLALVVLGPFVPSQYFLPQVTLHGADHAVILAPAPGPHHVILCHCTAADNTLQTFDLSGLYSLRAKVQLTAATC